MALVPTLQTRLSITLNQPHPTTATHLEPTPDSTKSDLPTLNTLDLDESAGHCLLDPSSKGENPHHALALRESVVGEIEAKDGLPSADRNNKATLLLTGPFRTAKSSAKDLTPLVLKLQYAKYHDALGKVRLKFVDEEEMKVAAGLA